MGSAQGGYHLTLRILVRVSIEKLHQLSFIGEHSGLR
jgi:hypothetical protein